MSYFKKERLNLSSAYVEKVTSSVSGVAVASELKLQLRYRSRVLYMLLNDKKNGLYRQGFERREIMKYALT